MSQWHRFIIIFVSVVVALAAPNTIGSALGDSQALFSPAGGIQTRILRSINMSRRSIDVAMFTFTSGELAQGLAGAYHRGLRVRVILAANQSDEPNSEYRYLKTKGVPVKLASGRPPKGIMHHKFAIFDGREIVTGSYNWTHSAEHKNYENILFVDDPKIIESFVKEFEALWSEGRPEK